MNERNSEREERRKSPSSATLTLRSKTGNERGRATDPVVNTPDPPPMEPPKEPKELAKASNSAETQAVTDPAELLQPRNLSSSTKVDLHCGCDYAQCLLLGMVPHRDQSRSSRQPRIHCDVRRDRSTWTVQGSVRHLEQADPRPWPLQERRHDVRLLHKHGHPLQVRQHLSLRR